MPCYILICPIAESHISWNSIVTLSFLGDLFASRRWSRERDFYLTHKLVYFLDHRPPKLTLRVWNVLMLFTYTLLSLVRWRHQKYNLVWKWESSRYFCAKLQWTLSQDAVGYSSSTLSQLTRHITSCVDSLFFFDYCELIMTSSNAH